MWSVVWTVATRAFKLEQLVESVHTRAEAEALELDA